MSPCFYFRLFYYFVVHMIWPSASTNRGDAFLVFEPPLLYFQYFLSPLGLKKKRKKLAIKSVFLVSDNLLCLKPKAL
jgi:hypothetical protein